MVAPGALAQSRSGGAAASAAERHWRRRPGGLSARRCAVPACSCPQLCFVCCARPRAPAASFGW